MAQQSIFEKKIHPLVQAGGVAALVFTFQAIIKLLQLAGVMEHDDTLPWELACSFLLFYAMVNSILCMPHDNQNKYWMYSILGYILLALFGAFFAGLFSGVNIDEAGTFRWIYVVLTMGYLIIFSIVRLIRTIMLKAQEFDDRQKHLMGIDKTKMN